MYDLRAYPVRIGEEGSYIPILQSTLFNSIYSTIDLTKPTIVILKLPNVPGEPEEIVSSSCTVSILINDTQETLGYFLKTNLFELMVVKDIDDYVHISY